MDEKSLSDFTTDELIAEINDREEMHKVLDSVGVDSLIEAISEQVSVREISVKSRAQYVVCVENGEFISDTGGSYAKTKILIIED